MALTSKQKLAKKSKLAKKQNDVPQPVSTHAPCTKRRGKAWYRQECLPELASGWRELQEHTPAHSGRELHQQGHEIPCEDLLPQCSTPSSVQGQSQGKGSLAQTCSDNIPKILFQQCAVRSFLHHRCCFQSGLSKIGFMPLFYPGS